MTGRWNVEPVAREERWKGEQHHQTCPAQGPRGRMERGAFDSTPLARGARPRRRRRLGPYRRPFAEPRTMSLRESSVRRAWPRRARGARYEAAVTSAVVIPVAMTVARRFAACSGVMLDMD